MAGTIAAMVVVVWFYRTAVVKDKDPIKSGLLGFIVYFVPSLIWSLTITPGMKDAVQHSPGTFSALVVQYTYIFVGLICAAFVRSKHFADSNQKSDS